MKRGDSEVCVSGEIVSPKTAILLRALQTIARRRPSYKHAENAFFRSRADARDALHEYEHQEEQ